MIVELIDNGTSRPAPSVTFDPVGRFTPGWLDSHNLYICGEIQRAQMRARTGLNHTRGSEDDPNPSAAVLVDDPENPDARRAAVADNGEV